MAAEPQDALLKEYGEAASTFRTLTDIRFKLLAFLPITAGAAAVLTTDSPVPLQLVLSLFGLAITVGLLTYNARNDQLYDDLAGRAAEIERTLGLLGGSFSTRPQPWLKVQVIVPWKVDHGTGIATIYTSTLVLWLYGAFSALGVLVWRAVDPREAIPSVLELPMGSHLIALVLAVVAIVAVRRSIRRQRQARENQMRRLAFKAVNRAQRSEAIVDDELLATCATLAGRHRDVIAGRAHFLAGLTPETRAVHLPPSPSESRAAHLVANLTDLPPRWLLDCYTNRRGRVDPADMATRAAR